MFDIIPSLMGANQLALGADIQRVEPLGALHIDMEDGLFSSDITLGVDAVTAVCAHTAAVCDAHLMVMEPLAWPRRLAAAGVKAVCAHIETLRSPARFLDEVHSLGMRAGLALMQKTPVEQLEAFAAELDYVLFWANEDDPDMAYRPYTAVKVERARRLLPENVEIWADGGIGEKQLPALKKAGLTKAVVGRALFATGDPCAEYKRLLAAANG